MSDLNEVSKNLNTLKEAQKIGKDTAKDIEKLKFMIKINDAICAAKTVQGSQI